MFLVVRSHGKPEHGIDHMGDSAVGAGITGKYLERAEELRSIANDTDDEGMRAMLIRAAETYERLAARIRPEPPLNGGSLIPA